MHRKGWSTYKSVNAILLFALGMMFFYVGLFYSPGQINCIVKLKTGLECSSCGLTRDYHAILRFNFASLINEYSVQTFLFFLAQLIARGSLFLFSKSGRITIFIDIFISVVLFLFSFYPLLRIN